MKKFFFALAILCTSTPVFAGSSAVWWPGWKVTSSEELYDEAERKYSTYPLPLMFDNDPKTAWVYSAKSKEWDKGEFRSRYGIELKPERPITIDSLRIMNGQNASRARFLRNNRVLRMRVTMNEGRNKIVRTFNLGDRMGWHTCKLPSRTIKRLKLEFVGIRKGRDNDVCISEVALFNGGRQINLQMPRAVMSYDGTPGCVAFSLITRNGRVLEGTAADIGFTEEWSPNGRYVSGVAGDTGLWIADSISGRIVRRLEAMPHPFDYQDYDYAWLDNHRLRVKYRSSGSPKVVVKILRLT